MSNHRLDFYQAVCRMRPLLLLLIVAALLAGCAVNPVTGRKELALVQVSPQEEIALGEKAFPQAVQEMGGEIQDPQLAAYLQSIGERLAGQSERPDYPWKFRVVNDGTPNAFALPGGFIAITRGLLLQLENEAQLAAVVGHEIGHVTARHAVQGMQRGALLGLGLTALTDATGSSSYGPLVQTAGQLTATLLDRSYSREQEREADRLGIDYMVRTGFHPQGAVQLQEIFYREIEGGREPQRLTGLFRTHPFSRERMLENRDYIGSRYPQATGAIGIDSFQGAIAGLKTNAPAFALYERARELEKQGETGQAITTYLKAATAAPDEYLILTGLGMAYLRAGNAAAARPHLSRAAKANPNYYLTRMGMGYLLLQQKEASKAVRELQASMKLLATVQGAFLLGEAYEATGEKRKSAEMYQAVAQADPEGKLGRTAAERLKARGE